MASCPLSRSQELEDAAMRVILIRLRCEVPGGASTGLGTPLRDDESLVVEAIQADQRNTNLRRHIL